MIVIVLPDDKVAVCAHEGRAPAGGVPVGVSGSGSGSGSVSVSVSVGQHGAACIWSELPTLTPILLIAPTH